jgi:hypothetical protein
MDRVSMRREPSVAPFPVEHIDGNRYRTRLVDISDYVKEWSHGSYTYVDARYVGDWLQRIGVPIASGSVDCFLDDEAGQYLVEWEMESQEVYQAISYEDAWARE